MVHLPFYRSNRLKPVIIKFLALASVVFLVVTVATPPTSANKRLRQSDSSLIYTKKDILLSKSSNLRAAGNSLRMSAPIPALLYGTAWKKERTEELVTLAVRTGFQGIDTACQPKHYYEPGVGAALTKLIADGVTTRDKIFLQTKYTPFNGQDPANVPYDKNAPLDVQVEQSFRKSLENLHTDYLDSLVLHSPLNTIEDTMTVWRAFERIHGEKGAVYLGISNCYDLEMLKAIYAQATVKPSFLQNRFYKESGYDRSIRAFCREKGIKYQSFWTLTANPTALNSGTVKALAVKYGKTTAQIFFRFMQLQDVLPLTGTKDRTHMEQDLSADQIPLTAEEVASIDSLLK